MPTRNLWAACNSRGSPAAERLRPVGATLLAATEASGAAELGEPETGGRGAIQQGCLEQSNVDVETELADIERLQSLLKSLPTASAPRDRQRQGSRSSR